MSATVPSAQTSSDAQLTYTDGERDNRKDDTDTPFACANDEDAVHVAAQVVTGGDGRVVFLGLGGTANADGKAVHATSYNESTSSTGALLDGLVSGLSANTMVVLIGL